jgi:hypothetical protein
MADSNAWFARNFDKGRPKKATLKRQLGYMAEPQPPTEAERYKATMKHLREADAAQEPARERRRAAMEQQKHSLPLK